jgi:hydantoinase/carbamoylase family amidase
VTLGEALQLLGDDGRAAAAAPPRDDLVGWCEAHIEQGPVLQGEDLPVGVVTTIAGQTRVGVRLAGTAGHAGTVPMAARRDALAGAAELVTSVERRASTTTGLVATVGELHVRPGASNVIPGEVLLTLDVRHADDAARSAAVATIEADAARDRRASRA